MPEGAYVDIIYPTCKKIDSLKSL